MSFLRHWEIYRVRTLLLVRERQVPVAPALILSMSFRLVIPDGLLSSSARFCFANRRALSEKPSVRGKQFLWPLWASLLSLENRGSGP
jgi:hypothetical protein